MSYLKDILWLNIVLLLIHANLVSSSKFKFTNAKCEDHDVAFSRIKLCKLSVLRRGVVTLNIYLGLHNPLRNSTIKVALYRRVNGYQPYLFNKSADLCAYLAQRNKYPLMHVIFSMFVKNSNLNHTCPYHDSIVVKDLVLDESMFQLLPLPNGQYLFKLMFYAYNDLKQTFQIFYTRTD